MSLITSLSKNKIGKDMSLITSLSKNKIGKDMSLIISLSKNKIRKDMSLVSHIKGTTFLYMTFQPSFLIYEEKFSLFYHCV
jgi:hypothetical protein